MSMPNIPDRSSPASTFVRAGRFALADIGVASFPAVHVQVVPNTRCLRVQYSGDVAHANATRAETHSAQPSASRIW